MSVIAVVGSAPCAMDDLAALMAMREDVSVCTLNGAIRLPIRMEYFLTGHPQAFRDEILEHRAAGFMFDAIGADRCDGYDTTFRPHGRMAWGGSAANAICFFRPRGFRVVLCGCPMDGSGHFYDKSGDGHDPDLWVWFRLGHPHREAFNSGVRSMSGNTKELFGYPTKEWLNEPC